MHKHRLDLDHRAGGHRRLRVRTLMMLIAVLGLIFATIIPVIRDGPPPCLTSGQTLRHMIANRGSIRCDDCHAQRATITIRTLVPTLPSSPTCPALSGATKTGTARCISCHQTMPRS